MFDWLRPQNIPKYSAYVFVFGEFFGQSQPNTPVRELFLKPVTSRVTTSLIGRFTTIYIKTSVIGWFTNYKRKSMIGQFTPIYLTRPLIGNFTQIYIPYLFELMHPLK